MGPGRFSVGSCISSFWPFCSLLEKSSGYEARGVVGWGPRASLGVLEAGAGLGGCPQGTGPRAILGTPGAGAGLGWGVSPGDGPHLRVGPCRLVCGAAFHRSSSASCGPCTASCGGSAGVGSSTLWRPSSPPGRPLGSLPAPAPAHRAAGPASAPAGDVRSGSSRSTGPCSQGRRLRLMAQLALGAGEEG